VYSGSSTDDTLARFPNIRVLAKNHLLILATKSDQVMEVILSLSLFLALFCDKIVDILYKVCEHLIELFHVAFVGQRHRHHLLFGIDHKHGCRAKQSTSMQYKVAVFDVACGRVGYIGDDPTV